MSLTITVTEVINPRCYECGNLLHSETDSDGIHRVVPCNECLRAARDEGYASGKEEE